MKTKSVIVTTSCAGVREAYTASDEPQELPLNVADDLIRAGHAIDAKDAKAIAARKETTSRKLPAKRETTAS